MKKIFVYMSISLLVLSGCGSPDTTEDVAVEKQPYYITTSTVRELSTANTVKKSGRLVGAQAVTVSSLVPGRVTSIAYDNGQRITNGTTVVRLSDTSGSFSFNAQRAKTQLDNARINYDSTLRNIDKSIADTALGVKQAQTQYNAADQVGGGSTALQLEQLDEQVKKAEFDYQTQLTNNQQTIDNFLATAKNLAKDVELLYTNIKNEGDAILGVTSLNRNKNDTFEQYLGSKNSSTTRSAEAALKYLISQESFYTNIGSSLSKDNLPNGLTAVKALAGNLQPLLDDMERMFEYTTSSPNYLPESQLAGFKATVDGLQNQVQGQVSGITQQINSIQSFLATYKEQEASLRKQVDITKQQIATTKSSLQDNEIQAEIGVENAVNNYTNAIDSKETTLASLNNSIEQARIAYNEAQTQLGKFTVETPIDGTIGEILVDVGQEVNAGTPLFTINSTNEQQVEIGLSETDLAFVDVGQEVAISIDGEKRSGTVQSISTTADQNFIYPTIISLEGTVELFGDVVDVEIPVRTPHPIIPINVVSILSRNEGLVNTRTGREVEPVKATFGKVWGSNVEILSELDDDLVLIISDIKNFNANKQRMLEKQ